MRGKAWKGHKPYKLPVTYCHDSDKVMFDKKGARTAANDRFRREHEALRIYPCPACKCWHLTSTRVWRKK